VANNVTPGRWISMGWAIFKEDIGNFILITLIAGALASVANFVVAGPLLAGMFIAVKRRMLHGRTDLMDLFAGFNLFIDAFLVGILTAIFTVVGLALCIFPALIVAAFYLFAYLFLVDRKLGFWEAMESSRRLVVQDLLGYILFVFLLLLFNLLGLILLGVGLLVTIPVSVAAIAVAYKETVGFMTAPVEAPGPVHIP
jgi:uncharacterized membrane protein